MKQTKSSSNLCRTRSIWSKWNFKGRKATCYPGCEEKLKGAVLSEEAVVRDKNVTTSRGVGTAIAFALELISQLEGEVKAHQIKINRLLKMLVF